MGWYIVMCGMTSEYPCGAVNLMQFLPFLSFMGLDWYVVSR
jgi:hypothetical protein